MRFWLALLKCVCSQGMLQNMYRALTASVEYVLRVAVHNRVYVCCAQAG